MKGTYNYNEINLYNDTNQGLYHCILCTQSYKSRSGLYKQTQNVHDISKSMYCQEQSCSLKHKNTITTSTLGIKS